MSEHNHRNLCFLRGTSCDGQIHIAGLEKTYALKVGGSPRSRKSISRSGKTILLIDEPFAALDAMTREELRFSLMRIWDPAKKTVIFVTHNIAEAMACDLDGHLSTSAVDQARSGSRWTN
jgi:ABC-type nitrate/sulfonate/bicarbonate transport system ATPase subunit